MLNVSWRSSVFKLNSALKITYTLTCLAFLGAVASQSAVAGTVQEKKTPKMTTRGLASLRPVKPTSQGEAMLNSVKESDPRFLKPRSEPSAVSISGVCRDGYGVLYNSSDLGYGDCMDSRANRTSNLNQYWGGGQRQAGVGILVGN